MYAWQLFETIKKGALEVSDSERNDCIASLGNDLYRALRGCEDFSEDDAIATVYGAFACVACNDGKISYDEYLAFKGMASKDLTYDDFFKVMTYLNRQQQRDATANNFNRISHQEVAKLFIDFCIIVCVADGSIHLDEELFCTSLCEVFLNRFLS